MTILAVIVALLIAGALCVLAGYAAGVTYGRAAEVDGLRDEIRRLDAAALRSSREAAPAVATSPSARARGSGGAVAVSGDAVAIVEEGKS